MPSDASHGGWDINTQKRNLSEFIEFMNITFLLFGVTVLCLLSIFYCHPEQEASLSFLLPSSNITIMAF